MLLINPASLRRLAATSTDKGQHAQQDDVPVHKMMFQRSEYMHCQQGDNGPLQADMKGQQKIVETIRHQVKSAKYRQY